MVPQLLPIREQANQKAVGKLVSLSVEAESENVGDVRKWIEIEVAQEEGFARPALSGRYVQNLLRLQGARCVFFTA